MAQHTEEVSAQTRTSEANARSNNSPLKSLIQRSPLGSFFVLAYVLSWIFIVPWSVSESPVGLG